MDQHDTVFALDVKRVRTSRLICIAFLVLVMVNDTFCKDMLKDDFCSIYDSCGVKEFFRTCSCDSDCYRYRTCCEDSPEFMKMKDSNEQFQCYSEGTPSPVFAKRTCSEDWQGDHGIVDACLRNETINTTSDFIAQVLVSSNKTETTYWNWNCALCNGEDISNLMFWTVQMSCFVDSLKTHMSIPQAKENVAYNETKKYWGLVAEEENFVPCSVSFYQPAFLVGKLRLCAPHTVSTCAPGWRNKDIADKCLLYYGERKLIGKDLYFRNTYCALCNNVRVEDLECLGRNYRTASSKEDFRVLKVVFNLNSWTGEHRDAERDCPKKYQRYDPFLKVCRDLGLGVTNVTHVCNDCEMQSTSGQDTTVASFLVIITTILLLFSQIHISH